MTTMTGTTAEHAPEQDLLVVFKLASRLAWLDPATLAVRHSLALPPHGHELLVDEAARRAYVSVYGNGIYGNNTLAGHALVVVDLDAHSVVDVVDLPGHGSHGLTRGTDGTVWVSCDRSALVVGVDPKSLTVEASIRLDDWATPHWIVATPDGRKAYTSNKATDHLTVLDLTAAQVQTTIPMPTGCEGLSLDSTGGTLYVTDHSGAGLPGSTTSPPQLRAIDTSTDTVTSRVDLQLPELDPAVNHELRVRVAPDDQHVLVSADHWNLVLVLDAADLTSQRSVAMRSPMGFAFPPGYGSPARTCLVMNHDPGTLTSLDVQAAEAAGPLTPTGGPHEGPETAEYVQRVP